MEKPGDRLESTESDYSEGKMIAPEYIPSGKEQIMAMISREVLPTGPEVHSVLTSFDFGLKAQMGITAFIDLMVWTSVSEIGLFIITFLCFLRSPHGMGYVFLHLPHIGRGICGFFIINRTPRVHNLLDMFNPARQGEDSTV